MPDGHGDEHEAWFVQRIGRWYKATYPDRFGLSWSRDGSATALEYLTRLTLQNTFFGDDIRLEALINWDNRLRVLTSQPHIEGEPAKYDETRNWFIEAGFRYLELDGRIAWYQAEENLLVADAHEGNVVRTPSTGLIPIDLNIVQPTGELREWALRESEKSTQAEQIEPNQAEGSC